MLQKFLFVGLGGSGGKTLRMLHENLETRLLQAGWTGGLPAGWQFLHVDVPVTPDGSSPDLPAQLPPGHYVGMAPRGLSYRDLDALIEHQGPMVAKHVAGWRPDGHSVAVAPAFGAGQYRAVGRTITGVALPAVVEALRRSASALEDVAVDQELDRVSQMLTGKAGVSPHEPQVIVVASIAGGSGAGSFLDVCDAIRQLMPRSRAQIAAVLYTPEVFSELPPKSRSGVNANGLAALCELIAGYWNNAQPAEDEFAFLNAAGVAIGAVEQRGPSQTFLVGKANGEVAFAGQLDVYRAVAKALTAWTSDAAVQDAVHATVIGNWSQKAARSIDRSPLAPGRLAPFSALGYASVDLGRERFGRYAVGRLARAAVERALRGHWDERVPKDVTSEVAAQELASDQLYNFLDACRLNELGPVHNQVIDAIRGGAEHEARQAWLSELRQDILQQVIGPNDGELDASLLMERIEGRVGDAWHPTLDSQYEADKERARQWYNERQDAIAQSTAELLGRIGGPATAKVVELAVAEITAAIVPELDQMAASNRRIVGTMRQRIHSAFGSVPGKLMAGNPVISKGIREGLDSIHAEAEARLYELSARLLVDLADHFLDPLRIAVLHATSQLEEAGTSRPDRPSIVDEWPVEVPPRSLHPAQNELLLEQIDTYPSTFIDLVRQTVGLPDEQGALLEAVRQVVAGTDEEGRQTLITITRRWVPSQQSLRTMGTSGSALFRLALKPERLLERSRAWVQRPDSAIGGHVGESIADYLSGERIDPAEHKSRLDAFGAALRAALNTARPLIDLDPAANGHFHGDHNPEPHQVMSPMPFPRNHPGRDVVADVLHGLNEAELAKLFDDSNRQRIDITTFLDAPVQPMVISSLIGPIAGEWAQRQHQQSIGGFWQWRRARPLRDAVPVAPEVRRALIRGWFIARMLDHISMEDPRTKPVTVLMDDGRAAPLPFPLLGAPIVRPDGVLPAVLESLGIAIVASPREALRPYHRLAELGAEGRAYGGLSIPEILQRWLLSGEVMEGAPTPRLEKEIGASDDASKRTDALTDALRKYVAHYEAIAEQRPGRGADLPRVWEIAPEIALILNGLREEVSGLVLEPMDRGIG